MEAQLAILAIQALIKYAPELKSGIQALLAKDEITEADWKELFDKAQSKSYDDYVKPSNPA